MPFERFLPPHPAGVFSAWLEKNLPQGSLVLDPLGGSPLPILEAARAGYRVLAVCNNPVVAAELRLLASAPNQADFSAALSELATQRKGEERLEVMLRSLYATRCASCGGEIQADGFLWRKGANLPHARLYTCPHCQDSGEHPITDEDIQRLQPLQRSEKLHRARALERVLRGKHVEKENVEESLAVYPSRAIYVLFTLMNKLEGMNLPPRRRELLEGLLLTTLDTGNSIWAYPELRERPRQLSVPAQYLEKNLWSELENASAVWTSFSEPVPLTLWPEMPDGAGVCLFAGRMRELAEEKPPAPDATLCLFPRPNQAFWTLSALWAAWLWEDDRAEKLRGMLDRRRFDWHWHTSALHAALHPAGAVSGEGKRMFGVIPEPAPGLVTAVIQSAAVSGYQVNGLSSRNAVEPVQVEWLSGSPHREQRTVNMQKIARDAIREMLQEIGEPTDYIELHAAVMAALAQEKAFPSSIQQLTSEKAAEVTTILNGLLNDKEFLRRLDATAQDPESGLWWLAQPANTQTPLADRLELELAGWLQKQKIISALDVLPRVNQRFPGYLTPPEGLVRHCLEAYAVYNLADQTWHLNQYEGEEARNSDVEEMRELVTRLAEQFRLSCSGEYPILWKKNPSSESALYRIIISSQAVIDRELLHTQPDRTENILLMPGSRAGLLKYKFDRDPYLRECVEEHWHFVKFRAMRSIASREDLSLELWKMLIDSDPISLEETTQLSVFQ